MSNLNEETIKHLSQLCRIEISPEEEPAFLRTLQQVVDYFGQLSEVDVSTLSPYSHVMEQGVDALREDVPEDPLDRTLFLANAPEHIGGMIRIPPVFKQNP